MVIFKFGAVGSISDCRENLKLINQKSPVSQKLLIKRLIKFFYLPVTVGKKRENWV